ncbi:MAG: porin [Labilithrix sp.]|nr:porin [Labilithrix sp.]MCW5811160.1 porin [Labilithrix sp.]
MPRGSFGIAAAALLWCASARAQDDGTSPKPERPAPHLGADSPAPTYPPNPEHERRWYDRLTLRGYTQLRYNRLGASNSRLTNRQGDRTLGDDGGLSIRRARLIFQGDIASFLSVYLQPDFASVIDETFQVATLRDWYADIFLDPDEKRFRVRVGQSKVPYGWELMQSSGNRLPLDRTDGINSAFVNERDLGVFLYFETPAVRGRFRHLVESGLKGSGDFGMVAFGVMNGQPMNTREKNDNKHFVARVTYPFDVGSQTLELSAAAYSGLAVVSRDEGIAGREEAQDFRALASFVLYPKPLGFQAEYNAGYGPELVGKTIEKRPLAGGYAMTMWRQPVSWGAVTPYVRVHHYDGGKKFETNAPRYDVKQLDAGVEWQLFRWIELTTELMLADRTTKGDRQTGHVLRLQLQFNY